MVFGWWNVLEKIKREKMMLGFLRISTLELGFAWRDLVDTEQVRTTRT